MNNIAAYLITYRHRDWSDTAPDATAIEFVSVVRRSLAEVIIPLENAGIIVVSARGLDDGQAVAAARTLQEVRL